MDNINQKALTQILSAVSPCNFDELAINLFRKFCIRKVQRDYTGTHVVYYRFKEIEYYFYNSDTNDCPTLNRDCLPGQWYIHRYGVDLTFGTKVALTDIKGKEYRELVEFGGILIRGLEKITEAGTLIIGGPQRCLFELFNSATQFPEICSLCEIQGNSGSDFTTIFKGIRVLGNSTKDEEGRSLPYRYYVGDVNWLMERPQICEIQYQGKYHVVWKNSPYKYDDHPLDNDLIVIENEDK